MRKHLLLLGILASCLFACKDNSNLVEVQLPEPEEIKEPTYLDPKSVKIEEGAFSLVTIPYQFGDLEPHFDGQTMEIHFSKHYVGYTNKMNAALKEAKIETKKIEEVLALVSDVNPTLKNNAGGYYNHTLFFEILTPKSSKQPKAKTLEAINSNFGSYDEFKRKFILASTNHFGSGWAWLVVINEGKLAITTTTNQDNPLMPNATIKGTPILGLDLWEHSYYLKYQNKRADYIEAFFEVINWEVVETKLEVSSKTQNPI
ncbi:MAG: superoxide dismutase [Flavobacterium sp.]|nr:superoxide dismutase [Flavobacterium sp.]